jgi:asparagine synthase (glutamine-hydrolysing)
MGRYWDFPCFEEKIDDERIVLETAKELLTEAVRERLRSPSSLGLLFSGGTDSSLLLGIIARISNKRIKTYTIIEGLREEQRNMASALALAFGTDHTEIHLTPERVAKTIKEIVWHASLPTVGSLMEHVGATEAYSQGVSVLFSGHMADSVFQAPSLLRYTMPLELMLSPARLLPDAIRTRIYDFGEKILRPVFTGHSAIIPRRFLYPTYLYFRRKRGLFRRYNTGIFPKDARALFHSSIDRSRWRSPADSCRAIYRECPSGRLDERLTYTVVKLFASVNATIHESIGAAQSVQIQAPFLDQQLFEFAQRIPFSLKGKGGNEKYIIRELCRIFVSEQCSIQRKAAFTPPFETWLRKDLWHFVEDVLSRESIERRGVFDHQAVAALCARFKEGRSIIGWADIWALVVIEIWLRLHCDSHLSNSEQSSGRIA